MTEGLDLRRFRPEDRPAVIDLQQIALRDAGAFAGRGAWDADLGEIEEVYLKGGEFVVGFVDERLVAMGALKRLAPGQAEIKRMQVDPDYQRRGFGKAVLDYLEAAAAGLGISTLVLDTTAVQVAALAFYGKNGYRETGRRLHSQFELVFFAKQLGSTSA